MVDYIKETLNFKELSPEEKSKRGILGRLYGPIADIVHPTRNGRTYTDEVWSSVFNKNAIVKEMFANGGIPGELDHPAEREEIDSSKIAIMMPEPPKKDKSGRLIAYFDILDTPNGRITYELAKYGFKLGISSRGSGDVLSNGEVDPDSYSFTCFDIVLIPSVKEARLNMTEGLKDKGFKTALCEALNKADEDSKKIMNETLKDLNIKVEDTNKEPLKEDEAKAKQLDKENDDLLATALKSLVSSNDISNTVADKILDKVKSYKKPAINIQESITATNSVENKSDNLAPKQIDEENKEAINDGSKEVIKNLQEALKSKSNLETKIQSLQEQLAVSNSKVSKLEESITSLKQENTSGMENVVSERDAFKKRISELEEDLKVNSDISDKQKNQLGRLIKDKLESKKSLDESISNNDSKIASLNENLTRQKTEYENKLNQLKEEYEKKQIQSSSLIEDWKSKASKALQIKEKYKELSNNTVNSYISNKAIMLDVSPEEIKNKLPESYTLNDIDRVCDSLQNYALNIRSLPFRVDRKVNKVAIRESKQTSPVVNSQYDDTVDESLLTLAGINK